MYTLRFVHLSIIVYILCAKIYSMFASQTDAQSLLQFDSNRTNSNVPLTTTANFTPKNGLKAYFQSLFGESIPFHLDHSKTKVFLISPINGSNEQLLTNSNDLVYNVDNTSIGPRKSVYMLFPNNHLTGRSATSSVSQPNLNTNNSLIENPFASSPYKSSNEIINTLIKNIFSDLTLQSLPPEEVLFGKIPSSLKNTQEIFSNITKVIPTLPPSSKSDANSNTYSPLSLSSPNTNQISQNGPTSYSIIPKRFEAGVEYSEPNDPSALDHDLYSDFNRFHKLTSSTQVPKLSITPEKIITTITTDVSTIPPINYENYQPTILPTVPNKQTSFQIQNLDAQKTNWDIKRKHYQNFPYTNFEKNIELSGRKIILTEPSIGAKTVQQPSSGSSVPTQLSNSETIKATAGSYISISQRSKLRDHTRTPVPRSSVFVDPEIAKNLINIISLPNYKFYLGKKTHL